MILRGLLLLVWIAAAPGLAQDVEREVAALRTDFEYGKYAEVLQRGQSRLDQGLDDPQLLLEVHKLAGVSAFNLGKLPDAERHLGAALRIDPDFTLDPFVFPPAVIEFQDQLRQRMSPELERIRQSRELELARRRAAESEAERVRLEEERRRLAELPRRVTTETIDRRSFFVNFVPFGAGQFQQGRTELGLWLASLQGATATASVIAYWAHEALIEERPVSFPGTLGPKVSVRLRGIPPEDAQTAANWRLIKNVSALSFYGLYAYGVIDALLKHKDAIVTTTTVEEAPRAPTTVPPPPPKPGRNVLQLTRPQTFLFPTPGGFGAGVEVRF
ncbi:MAG: hypothetical protein M3Y59_20400 [Myxococcota bacterium]|nr:hypothetical protein [Myxococcota bacterium]